MREGYGRGVRGCVQLIVEVIHRVDIRQMHVVHPVINCTGVMAMLEGVGRG